jgi:hypothetical protein
MNGELSYRSAQDYGRQALCATGRAWGGMGRHTRRTVHPQPHYSPTPATAHSRPQTRNGAHTSKKIGADNAENTPRIRRRRCMPYTLEERAAGRVRDPALYATGRARTGGRITIRLRGGGGAPSTHIIPSFQHATERPKSLGTLAGSCEYTTTALRPPLHLQPCIYVCSART